MPTITGTDSGETLAGTVNDDQISALGGNDTISLSEGNDVVDGGDGSDTISGTAAGLPGLPASARSYLLTPGHFSDGSGTLDTSFSNVEQVRFADLSGYDVSFDASAYSAFLQFNVGAGHHTLTGAAGATRSCWPCHKAATAAR
jgi:Ca2+-binding RTX toxin-like protein